MVRHTVTLNGERFHAQHGETLLDAARGSGIDLPYDCRAGHCGTCCVRLVSGDVSGGAGAELGIVHACQCRVMGDAVIEPRPAFAITSVHGVLKSVRPLSSDVVELGIRMDGALPYHAGQYAQVRFAGFPSRPFSITHPVRGSSNRLGVWFHVRRMPDGLVTGSLGKRIKPGHSVSLDGPFGSAHFRPEQQGRLILVATNTGFAPIWSIAVAALRENPARNVVVIVGSREPRSLYMGPALVSLARFRNVRIVRTCSAPGTLPAAVMPGRPSDYLPRLLPTDVIYACGAPAMVDSVKAIAEPRGVVCYADPFIPNPSRAAEGGVLNRAIRWFTLPTMATIRVPAPNRTRPSAQQPNIGA
jgi:NAD(P)H-flavin reductase/ferredoxin